MCCTRCAGVQGLQGRFARPTCSLRVYACMHTASHPPRPAPHLQLRCGGVLEAVRISCAGYPTKMPFLDFTDHFWMLATDSPQLDDRDFCHLVLRRVLGDEGWQMGKTKVGVQGGGGCCGAAVSSSRLACTWGSAALVRGLLNSLSTTTPSHPAGLPARRQDG